MQNKKVYLSQGNINQAKLKKVYAKKNKIVKPNALDRDHNYGREK